MSNERLQRETHLERESKRERGREGAGEVPFVGSFTEFVIGGSGGIRLFFEFEKVGLCLCPVFSLLFSHRFVITSPCFSFCWGL